MSDLWSMYEKGEIPHIHNSESLEKDIFNDALCYQAKRIKEHLHIAFPTLSNQELNALMFGENK